MTKEQEEMLNRLLSVYRGWNEKINLVSRKDIEELPVRHVLHSLAIAHVASFSPGARILDLGTGGGFPGIPLAIMFPDVKFTLADSIGKKIRVVEAIAKELGLKNVRAVHSRVEDLDQYFDYVVSRAVAPMGQIVSWTRKLILNGQAGSKPNGWLVLKGGDLREELAEFTKIVEIQPINLFWETPFFEGKYVVYMPLKK